MCDSGLRKEWNIKKLHILLIFSCTSRNIEARTWTNRSNIHTLISWVVKRASNYPCYRVFNLFFVHLIIVNQFWRPLKKLHYIFLFNALLIDEHLYINSLRETLTSHVNKPTFLQNCNQVLFCVLQVKLTVGGALFSLNRKYFTSLSGKNKTSTPLIIF